MRAAAIALLLFTLPATADELAPYRGRAIKDATRSPLVEATKPNWDRVMGRVPWAPGPSAANGVPTVEVRKNYVYIHDTEGMVVSPFTSNRDLQNALGFAIQQVYAAKPDDYVFVYVFTSFNTNVGAFFYAPLVNTDSGIGQNLFRAPGAPEHLEGYVFMNDWKSFEDQFRGFPPSVVNSFSMSVFNQEAGHRWGTQFEAGPGVSDGFLQQLLGRDDAHWSYFAHTGGSPMEGNQWHDNGNGSFTTQTDVRLYNYSDVDLYLMGLLPIEEVRPWFLITNPNTSGLTDIYNQPLGRASPPQIFQPLTVRGTRVDYTGNDLITRLGNRSPRVGRAPTRWRVAFAMLADRTHPLTDAEKDEFDGLVDMYAGGFKTGTRNLGELDYVLDPQAERIRPGLACPSADRCVTEAPLCARPALGSEDVCTKACANVQECPVGFCCAPGADGANICTPDGLCPRPPPPDAGVPDSGDPMMSTPDAGGGGVCSCDLTTACDPSCGCDPECPCTCDLTTGCDNACSCDPECGSAPPPLPTDDGSSCASTRADGLSALLLLALGAALRMTRARRSR